MFIDHGNKSARLSLRPHVVEMRAPANLPALGGLLSDLTVLSSSKKLGAYLTLTSGGIGPGGASAAANAMTLGEADTTAAGGGEEGGKKKKSSAAARAKKQREEDETIVPVFIHKSSLSKTLQSSNSKKVGDGGDDENHDDDDDDEQEGGEEDADAEQCIDPERLEKTYRAGSTVSVARVTGYHLVEGCVLASNLPTHLRSDVVHWSQVAVGSRVDVVVASIHDFGLIVRINGKVREFPWTVCPACTVCRILRFAAHKA